MSSSDKRPKNKLCYNKFNNKTIPFLWKGDTYMNAQRYKGKIALVTGAANGIGLSLTRRLVEEGAKVAAVDIEYDTMEKNFKGQEDDIYLIYCDVADKSLVDKAVADALEHFGRIDVLFSNAGIIGRKSLFDTTQEDWLHVINVNLNGTFYMNQAVLKSMVDRGIKGNVVNVSSIASTVVSTNTGAYSASKGAVTQFTKYAALEMAAYGIRVNAVGPGTHVTRITEGTRFDPVRCEKFLSNIPMGRFGEPEEAAAAALFLGSDDASYITGTTLLEDGGFTLF